MISSEKKEFPIEIVGGTTFTRYPKITDEITLNMMVTEDAGIKALVPYSGYQEIIAFPFGQPRETYTSSRVEEIIVVIGFNVYVVDSTFAYRQVGELVTSVGEVYISENQNNQIIIVDGVKGYIYNYALGTFSPISFGFPISPIYVDYLDTYFIVTDKNSGAWYISSPGDGTMWSVLDQGLMQTKADNLQAVVALDRTLWVIGAKAAELWHDNPTVAIPGLGQISFPFIRDSSFSIDYGCLSRQTIASNFQILVWLAFNANSGPTIVYTNGGKPIELSNDGLDFVMKNLTAPQNSSAFLFKENGHILYQITFYTDNLSIVYDFSSQLWYTVSDENHNFHIAKRVTFFMNKFLFINFLTPNPAMFQMSANFTTYNGATIPRTRIPAPIRFNDARFVGKLLEIGLEHGQSSDVHRVDLSLSKNGGEGFGNIDYRDLNAVGYRFGQVKFENFGIANDLRLKLDFWSDGRFVILYATFQAYV